MRLRDLNTKSYYLLVALSFLYSKTTTVTTSLKLALALTILVAVLPLQDVLKSPPQLEGIRWFKVIVLTLAFFCTIYWLWPLCVAAGATHN